MKIIYTFILVLIICAAVLAVEDSTDVVGVDSLSIDSVQAPEFDSLFFDTLSDTLTEGQKKLLEFEMRQQLMKQQREQESEELLPQFVWFDSFTVAMLSERLNYMPDIRRSFYRNAGDFFKSNPSYFTIDYQNTPVRSTVQPFGLTGNRLAVVYNGMPLRPFDHVVEPDGMIDVNDIPTASSEAVYIIPGPVSRLFGGEQTVASLITKPKRPRSTSTESTLLVDKGGFGYNFVRGRYSKLFSTGKEIDLSVEYRSSDGLNFIEDDDSYQYSGKAYFPIGKGYSLHVKGNSYRRNNSLIVFDGGITTDINHHRKDRTAEIALQKQNDSADSKFSIGYRYLKQTSSADRGNDLRNYYHGNGLFVSREMMAGSFLVKAEISGTDKTYFEGYSEYDRQFAKAFLSILKPSDSWSYLISAGTEYMNTYKTLPFGGIMLKHESGSHLFQTTIGYSERAPSLYELHLPELNESIYANALIYKESGNKSLVSEKQLVGSMLTELGSPKNNIRVTVTGGKILDAIDWGREYIAADTILFRPQNQDITFSDVNLTVRLALHDLVTLTSGGSLHWQDYELTEDKPYTPGYQMFGGAELHLFWKQKYTDLFAYGEIVFTDQYYGYDNSIMGENPVVNGKLSFHIKDFRFNLIFQNLLARIYETREGYFIPGRYTSFGFTWDFLD